jgi:polysaccharide export outer membrane protein
MLIKYPNPLFYVLLVLKSNTVLSKSHMKTWKTWLFPVAFCILLLPSLSSCYNAKKIVYFSNLKDTANGKFYEQDSIQRFQARIEPGDILDIHVTSYNAAADAPFNSGNLPISGMTDAGTTNGAPIGSAQAGTRGFQVDADGNIDYPLLGKISVSGKSTAAVRDTLENRLQQQYLKQPSVSVRFLNYKITILGEVGHPASYNIPSERVSIIDAIGMAGDLTIYGRRENILVVREVDGKREFARLNLSSSDIFKSPYYFLKQNDIVYVEPRKPKIAQSDDRLVRDISLGSGLLAFALSLIFLFK